MKKIIDAIFVLVENQKHKKKKDGEGKKKG